MMVILAATEITDVRANVDVTFDDRVLYLNGYIESFEGFDEYFGDAFASETGEFMSPEFSKIINDGRSSFISFVNSGCEIDALIDLDPTDMAHFSGVGSSYGDVFVDPEDADAGSAFGSSEYDVDFIVTDSTYRFSFEGTLASSSAGRSSATLYDGVSISSPQIFRVDTNTTGAGTFSFNGLLVPGDYRLDIFATTYINIPTAPGEGSGSAAFDFSMSLVPALGDFNLDGLYSCDDIDALVAAIAAGTDEPDFDLTGDGMVDLADRDAWLTEAGAAQVASGNAYQVGDANLDGNVDGADFLIWGENKFTNQSAWCLGDFTADGTIDGADFIEWNKNKFTSSDGLSVVPEPSTSLMMLVVAWPIWRRRRAPLRRI
jgi:hypothetical protein